MTDALTHRFAIVLRPLRHKDGERQTVYLQTRTAAQATREATARWPSMKVVEVCRAEELSAKRSEFPTEPDDDLSELELAHKVHSLEAIRRLGS